MGARIYKLLSWIIVLVAVFILFSVYADSRSLFLDELNLARNIIELDYLSLFSNLNYQQFAPPLYLVVVKLTTSVFGVSDISLRLTSLVLTLVSIFLFYKLSDKLLSFPSMLLALVLFCFSKELVMHGTEIKQYASDLFASVLLIYLAMGKYCDVSKYKGFWAILGGMLIWFSMPVVFVLSGVGFYWMYTGRSNRAMQIEILKLIGFWVISFMIMYFTILDSSISDGNLAMFHQPFYFGRNDNIGQQLTGIYSAFLDKTGVPVAIGILFTLLGIVKLYKSDRGFLLLLLSPIALMLVASYLYQYSIINRLLLFTLPFWILLIAFGFSHMYEQRSYRYSLRGMGIILSLLLVIVTLVNSSSLSFATKPLRLEEGKSIMQDLSKVGNADFYFTHHAIPTLEYYGYLRDDPIPIFGNIIRGKWDSDLSLLRESWITDGIEKIWIVDIHTFGEEKERLEQQISILGSVKETINYVNASARLIYLNSKK